MICDGFLVITISEISNLIYAHPCSRGMEGLVGIGGKYELDPRIGYERHLAPPPNALILLMFQSFKSSFLERTEEH